MASINKTALTLITLVITGSSIVAPVGAQAQSASDFLGSVGLGLGAGGNCDTDPSSEKGEVVNADGSTKTPYEVNVGKTNCAGSRDLIKHIADGALKNERRLIQSNHTLGMINSIGSIAAPLFGGLIANSQTRAQAAPPAPDSSQYLQVIQQQQQQIDELRQMMSQRQAPVYQDEYVRVQPRAQLVYSAPNTYNRQNSNVGYSSLRQTNLF
jgi:hypothetical protein